MRTIYSYIVYIILLLQLNSCNNEGLMYEYEHSTPIKFSSSCINVSTKSQGIIENNKLPKGSNILNTTSRKHDNKSMGTNFI